MLTPSVSPNIPQFPFLPVSGSVQQQQQQAVAAVSAAAAAAAGSTPADSEAKHWRNPTLAPVTVLFLLGITMANLASTDPPQKMLDSKCAALLQPQPTHDPVP